MLDAKQYQVIVRVEGIHCGSCLNRIDAALSRLNPIKIDMDIATKMIKVLVDDVSLKESIIESISTLGYEPHYVGTIEA